MDESIRVAIFCLCYWKYMYLGKDSLDWITNASLAVEFFSKEEKCRIVLSFFVK